MKKFLRFVVILLLVVAGAVVVLGIYEPKDKVVMRSVMIRAQKDVVFEQIVKFKNWPHWCPWYIMDSGKMKMTYYGTDGQPGSGYKWVGDKTGSGDMKDSAVNGTEMTYAVSFTLPSERNASGYLKATDTAGGTKVTWAMSIHFPFPFNAACVFMDMDKLLGGDFETGLGYLKTYVEAHNDAPAPDIVVEEVDYPAHLFEGIHSTIPMAGITKYFDSAHALMTAGGAGKINGPSAGIFYTWDTVAGQTDMAAVYPVSDTAKGVKGTSFIKVAGTKAAMVMYKGGYSKEMDAHGAIMKYIAAKGMQRSMVVEEYTVGPHEEADSNKWVTKIYYLIK